MTATQVEAFIEKKKSEKREQEVLSSLSVEDKKAMQNMSEEQKQAFVCLKLEEADRLEMIASMSVQEKLVY